MALDNAVHTVHVYRRLERICVVLLPLAPTYWHEMVSHAFLYSRMHSQCVSYRTQQMVDKLVMYTVGMPTRLQVPYSESLPDAIPKRPV